MKALTPRLCGYCLGAELLDAAGRSAVFTIPMLMDICAVYGAKNASAVEAWLA